MIAVTRGTATIAGIWSGLGMSMVETFEANHSLRLPMLLVALIFFFAPMILFVGGIDYCRKLRISFRHPYRHSSHAGQYWIETREVWLRCLCWFGGAALS